jgi:hypothetical protein
MEDNNLIRPIDIQIRLCNTSYYKADQSAISFAIL